MKTVKLMKAITVIGLTNLILCSAQAIPFKGKACPGLKINNPVGAQLMYSDTCDTVYVVPREKGEISFANPTAVATKQECQVINDRRGIVAQGMSDLENTIGEYNRAENALLAGMDLDDTLGDIFRIENEQITNSARRKIVNYNIESLREKRKKQELELTKCLEAGNSCLIKKSRLRSLNSKLQNEEYRLVEIDKKAFYLVVVIEALVKKKELQINNNTTVSSKLSEQKERIDEARSRLESTYKKYVAGIAAEFGADINFHLDASNRKTVHALKEANSGLGVGIESLPINSGTLSFYAIMPNENLSYPVVIRSMIAGFDNKPKNSSSSPETSLGVKDGEWKKVFMGDSLGGAVRINLLAYCAGLDSEGDFNNEKLASSIVANLRYNYDLAVSREYSIYKSMDFLHEIIRSSTKKKSGLFSTKTINKYSEKQYGDSYLRIDTKSVDSSFDFTDLDKLHKELRQEMLSEFVNMYGTGFFSNPKQVALTDGGKSGAAGAADELEKCKHQYCQYAAIGLRIGDSLFGGSKQISEMRKELKSQQRIDLRDLKAVKRSGTMNFVFGLGGK